MSRTIFVTGATGYIARHIVAGLLQRGDRVVGSTRDLSREAELRAALTPAIGAADWHDRFRLIALDLTSDDGWKEAMEGADALIHTASPFPIRQPKNEADLIGPAVDGTLRALRSAERAGISRVVLTSSTVAVAGKDRPEHGDTFTAADWSEMTHPTMSPYGRSKVLAERAAWDFARARPSTALTVMNPGFVIGPPLGDGFGTSVKVVERLLEGRDPMLPRLGFPSVDVRDVAAAHISALDREASAGNRYPLAERFLWFSEMARAVKAAAPASKVATRVAPDILIRAMALIDPSVRQITASLGRESRVSSEAARSDLGLRFRNAEDAVRDTAAWLHGR